MQVLDLDDLDAYADRLRQDRQEAVNLFHDLLIGVTAFFRDHEPLRRWPGQLFQTLFEGTGIEGHGAGLGAGLLDRRGGLFARDPAARIHGNADCATESQSFSRPISTIRRSRSRARALSGGNAAGCQPERIDRYFTGDGVSYTLTKEVRDLCIFSSHSVIRDPPFSRIDLISCRNLLIYMDRILQDQLVPVFHYSLRPGGFLFLGTSESLTHARRSCSIRSTKTTESFSDAILPAVTRSCRSRCRPPADSHRAKTGTKEPHWRAAAAFCGEPGDRAVRAGACRRNA